MNSSTQPLSVGILLAILAGLFVPLQFLGVSQYTFFLVLFDRTSFLGVTNWDLVNWGQYAFQVGGAFVVGLILGYLSLISRQKS